ncbi:aminoglycoside phosphotransferase family protein [Nonomuraea sp. NPDC005501]|uniref:aminoglycoside phosphotransferase family protein n=1 Tax=Nonomuraea sp. NPDC005501 TaxID=3156884 RepID=UPI0033AE6136
MQERLEGVGDEDVRHALEAWRIGPAVSLEYSPVGFGDYHWTATAPMAEAAPEAVPAGRKWFVTVADLGSKGYLGDGPEAAYRGLRRAMDAAAHLCEHSGLDFVVAPLRAATGGETVRRLGTRHAISVLRFVPGTPGRYGRPLTPSARHRVIDLLARLHQAEPPASLTVAPSALPHRVDLEQALDDTQDDRAAAWRGGPFGEPTRALLSAHAGALRGRLAELDRLTGKLDGRRHVVTHGEPHPGNVLTLGDRSLLIDWDTVGLAPPERDLWHVAEDQADLDRYAEATGHRPDPSVLAGYRLRWALDDVAAFAVRFRAPHDGGADSEQAWAGLRGTVAWLVSTLA